MKTLKTLLLAAALALAPALVSAQDIYAQALTRIMKADPVFSAIATDDIDVAFLIKYIGSAGTAATASGTAAVTAGDLLLKDGTVTAEVATTDITGCGGTAGTLDVDTAPCTSLGGLIDRINASAKWRAVILDGLRSDSTAGAKLLTLAATRATTPAGLGVTWDTSVAFKVSRALTPFRSMTDYLSGTRLNANPFVNTRCVLNTANATSTYASGTSFLELWSVRVSNVAAGGGETTSNIFNEAGGATTVNKVFALPAYGIVGGKQEKCLLRINNSAAMSVVTLKANGLVFIFQ